MRPLQVVEEVTKVDKRKRHDDWDAW
jgi:hypothetical protein